MDVLLPGMSPRLARWEGRACWARAEHGPVAGANRDAYERDAGVEPPGAPLADGPFARAAAAIARFDVFPPSLVTPVLAKAPVALGDAVGVCYRLAPGVRIFFASRVVETFDGQDGGLWRSGFRYRTLDAHPELGEEAFTVEKDAATGRVRVALRAWSTPGTLLAKLGGPLVRALQLRASNAAADRLAKLAAG